MAPGYPVASESHDEQQVSGHVLGGRKPWVATQLGQRCQAVLPLSPWSAADGKMGKQRLAAVFSPQGGLCAGLLRTPAHFPRVRRNEAPQTLHLAPHPGAWAALLPGTPGLDRGAEEAMSMVCFLCPGASLTGSPGKEDPSKCSLGSRVELITSSPPVAGGPAW